MSYTKIGLLVWKARCEAQAHIVGRQDRIHFVTDMGMLCRLVADGTGIGVLAERIAPDYIV